ncbi:SRPBCC family protein [Actinophytocola oryzae]|uniref:Polyketide cyclase/dehydrase/lipid transport protein n=1 Tax=Actinophytocola oryzae TaxID=502181 RepID=A0A4R7UVA4_9PSEU|nr:SRPBCC family protein [Actinophytocola oryzae]TDV38600.1 polyketide cyclase/dehydrase/lipid transport protein [Actinophytocola oryzae]
MNAAPAVAESATGETMEIRWSTVIDAPADEVWSYLRSFGNLADWIPTIDSCEIEDGHDDTVPGAVRVIRHGRNGSRERLLSNDDSTMTQTYEQLTGTLPVLDYRGTYQVWPVYDTDSAFVFRSCTFALTPSVTDPEALATLVRVHVFAPTMEALRRKLSRG